MSAPVVDDSRWTRRVRFGHGHDPRYVMCSTVEGYVTVEQLAAILGVSAGTARTLVGDRWGRQAVAEKIGNVWLIPVAAAHRILAERWHLA